MQWRDFTTQFAQYNQWMNEKIYAAAAQLTPAELARDRGAFFQSILGTLNHLLVADTLWLKRFANHPAHFSALAPVVALEQPKALNQIVFTDFASLLQRRQLLDTAINGMVEQLSDTDLEQILAYQSTQGIPAQKRFYQVLMHFFNHQTHHRGQITTLLTQAGVDVGATDLLLLVKNQPA